MVFPNGDWGIPQELPSQDDLPPDLDMVEIRGRLREEDYTPYATWQLILAGPTPPEMMVNIYVSKGKDGKTWENGWNYRMIRADCHFAHCHVKFSKLVALRHLEHGN